MDEFEGLKPTVIDAIKYCYQNSETARKTTIEKLLSNLAELTILCAVMPSEDIVGFIDRIMEGSPEEHNRVFALPAVESNVLLDHIRRAVIQNTR